MQIRQMQFELFYCFGHNEWRKILTIASLQKNIIPQP